MLEEEKKPEAAPEERGFEFRQCVKLLKSTGKKAKNLSELMSLIRLASDNSIYHHTYEFFFKERVLEYTNDFARWVGESLEARALSESLSNIDPYRFAPIAELRKELLNAIESYTQRFPNSGRVPPGAEFYFLETVTIVFPAGVTVSGLAGFLEALKSVDPTSVYYHFYEARSRVEGGVNDFSKWIGDTLGNEPLAAKITSIDPFMHSIEGIRANIADLVAAEIERGEARG